MSPRGLQVESETVQVVCYLCQVLLTLLRSVQR